MLNLLIVHELIGIDRRIRIEGRLVIVVAFFACFLAKRPDEILFGQFVLVIALICRRLHRILYGRPQIRLSRRPVLCRIGIGGREKLDLLRLIEPVNRRDAGTMPGLQGLFDEVFLVQHRLADGAGEHHRERLFSLLPQLSPDLGRHVIADGATVVLKVRQGRHSVILPPRVIALSLSHIPVTFAQGFRLFLTKTLHFGKGRDFIVKALIGSAAVVFVAVVLPDAFHKRINTGLRRSDVPGVPLTAHPLHRLPLSRPETILNAGLHRLTSPR